MRLSARTHLLHQYPVRLTGTQSTERGCALASQVASVSHKLRFSLTEPTAADGLRVLSLSPKTSDLHVLPPRQCCTVA